VRAATNREALPRAGGDVGEIAAKTGKAMIKFSRSGKGRGLTIKVLPNSGAERAELLNAIGLLLAD
jgi:hypothetical protein